MHDFLTVGAPAPLQEAGAVGMAFDADYYNQMALDYRERRELLCAALTRGGLQVLGARRRVLRPRRLLRAQPVDDVTFALWLAKEVGVATVPGSSFHATPGRGGNYVRFAFCKKKETLERAAERTWRSEPGVSGKVRISCNRSGICVSALPHRVLFFRIRRRHRLERAVQALVDEALRRHRRAK